MPNLNHSGTSKEAPDAKDVVEQVQMDSTIVDHQQLQRKPLIQQRKDLTRRSYSSNLRAERATLTPNLRRAQSSKRTQSHPIPYKMYPTTSKAIHSLTNSIRINHSPRQTRTLQTLIQSYPDNIPLLAITRKSKWNVKSLRQPPSPPQLRPTTMICRTPILKM